MAERDGPRRASTEPPTVQFQGEGKHPGFFARLLRSILFRAPPVAARPATKPSRYRQMWRNTVIAVSAVAIIPLITMTTVNYFLYSRAFQEQMTAPIARATELSKGSVESFLEERIAAARYILFGESATTLYQPEKLREIFGRMGRSYGGIVDVGIVDGHGLMRSYAGPHDLLHKSYRDQPWFDKVQRDDVHVSHVFLGHRKAPHFVIAVKRRQPDGTDSIFRATIDTEELTRQLALTGLSQVADAFIIDNEGVLQTASKLYGPPLSLFPGQVPRRSGSAQVLPDVGIAGTLYVMGYASLDRSPFVVVVLADRAELAGGWLIYQTEIFVLLSVSIILIILVVMSITWNWVGRIRHYELRREATLHKAEHANKMASIGRLAAGVAHEINNPLAIINEKAGLLQDIMLATKEMPQLDKMLKQLESIVRSVTRCKNITHRLLGFARHIDVKDEPLAVDAVIRDVLMFLEKEATYMRVKVQLCVPAPLPTLHSDKGQLQQLFLNLVNNALDAVDRGGHIAIDVTGRDNEEVEIAVMDDGCGIPEENLERILEPFFTTKEAKGTGLGLSICYGIVKKLRGKMSVESEVGIGTTFVIRLPLERRS
jgi:signal transduction histidine kinase